MTPDQLQRAFAAVAMLADQPEFSLDMQDKPEAEELRLWLDDWNRIESQARALSFLKPSLARRYEAQKRQAWWSIVDQIVEAHGFNLLIQTAEKLKLLQDQ